MPPGLDHIRAWVFDLDNTLYPSSADLFAQIDTKMTDYIARLLGLDRAEAHRIQKAYFLGHGTTLAGLMRHHDVLPDEYLAAVHAIDVEALLAPDPALRAMLLGLPYTRVVFTNGSALHAERVLGCLGVTDCFAEVFGLERVAYVAKPDVFDDGPAKPVRLWSRIGLRPIIAGGNSNGDVPMLQFAGGNRPALRLLVLHDDKDREFDYVAGAEKSLELAKAGGWTVVSMKHDWSRIFA